jgi:archaellum biogenesis ATPase FlaH
MHLNIFLFKFMELKQETKYILIYITLMRYKAQEKMFKRMRLISSKYVTLRERKLPHKHANLAPRKFFNNMVYNTLTFFSF